MAKPVCAVVGAGPANGLAFGQALAAEGYAVAMLSRDQQKLEELAAQVEGSLAVVCDATDAKNVKTAFDTITEKLGPVDVLLYNAGAGHFGSIDDVSATDMENNWRVNTLGLYLTAQAVLDDMKKKGGGTIVVTGATASLRGGARFAAFARRNDR